MSMEADASCGSDDIAIDVVADLSWDCEESRRHILIVGGVGPVGNVNMWKLIDDDVLGGEAAGCSEEKTAEVVDVPRQAFRSLPCHQPKALIN
jgi:hypothetical protein